MNYLDSQRFMEAADNLCAQSAQISFPGRLKPALFAARVKAYALAVSLSEEPFTSHGCYPRYGILSDGGELCVKCCQSEIDSVMVADFHDGWLLVDSAINYEGSLHCCNCSEKIESAYGDNEGSDRESITDNNGGN